MWNWAFWSQASWRATRTFAQSLMGLLMAVQSSNQFGTPISIPWYAYLYSSAVAALISLLQSIDRERAVGAVEGTPENTPEITTSTAYEPAIQADYSGCGTDLR